MQQDKGLLQVDRTLDAGRKPALLPLPTASWCHSVLFAFFVCFSFCFLLSIRSRVDECYLCELGLLCTRTLYTRTQ